MNKTVKWHKKLSNGFLHEKIVFFSFFFLLIVLSLDCFFQNLPLSGYCLVLITLVLIGCTTWATCHCIKWAINSSKPLWFYFVRKSQDKKWFIFVRNRETYFLQKAFNGEGTCLDSFRYPTSLNEQTRLLLKDIERDFVKTWYSEISQNPSFLFDTHLILEEIFLKIIKKLKTINCKNLILSVMILYLNHLQEYKKSVKKLVKLSYEDETKPKMDLSELCRFFHPGSQSDHLLNYYIKKLTKALLKEYAPHDFANSLECKILGGIIARNVFRRLLMTVEDPNWINLKLIYLLNEKRHEELLAGRVYTVKEKAMMENEEFQFKKPPLSRYLSSNIFESNRNLFDRNGFHNESASKSHENESKVQAVRKESLSLPLYGDNPGDGNKGNISTVLSGLISSTAGPLLPDNISVSYQALNKMWQSPVAEVKKDISETITNSFRKVFINGIKEKKGLVRSKSSEILGEVPGCLKGKDVSVGEELCEEVRFGTNQSAEDPIRGPFQKVKKLTKTRSFDNDSLIVDDVVEDKSPSPDHQREVSPVYEEPEDFATTIAKLRSLLQQRESTSTISDKSNASVDSQVVEASVDEPDTSNKYRSTEVQSFESQVVNDIPADGRLFVNVSIPKADLVSDPGTSPYAVYTIQYDGIYMLKDERNSGAEPELVLQTTTIQRRFQDFLHLQARLEENAKLKQIMKGIKGPSKWLHLPFTAKSEDFSSMYNKKPTLETFLRQLCSRVEISNAVELHEFLGYGNSGNAGFFKKYPASPSLQRIDKLLANKVTGVFNSIKTVLPSFDFDSTALVATNDTVKSFQEQKLLQGFLNFGNKPESFELNVNFVIKEPTGDSLSDDIRRYFSEKVDCVENAVDVLDSSDWLSEQRECRFITAEENCVWNNFKDVVLEDELEPLDSWLPIYSFMLDIICELLQDSDSWAIKEPVIRLIKTLSGHWESRFGEEISKLDWDRIFGNVTRLLRVAVFQSTTGEAAEFGNDETKTVLKEIIVSLMPGGITRFVTPEGVSAAVSLFVDSFQNFRMNRDVLLRLMDILLVHLLSCHHLAYESG